MIPSVRSIIVVLSVVSNLTIYQKNKMSCLRSDCDVNTLHSGNTRVNSDANFGFVLLISLDVSMNENKGCK